MELAHLERLIEEHALKNDAEMAPAEIKKIARYLDAKNNPDFYAETIQKFLAGDKLAKPKKGLILFVGSSSIRLWNTLADDMSPMQVINRGFGGAYIRHINYHFDDVVSRYKPRAVVFFCGTNDIAGLHSPESVFADFLRFYAMSREALPQTKIFVIGIKPTVSRAYLRKEEQDFNARIASLAGTEKGLFYIVTVLIRYSLSRRAVFCHCCAKITIETTGQYGDGCRMTFRERWCVGRSSWKKIWRE